MRKLTGAVLVAVLSFGTIAVTPQAAEARADTSWGCGGFC